MNFNTIISDANESSIKEAARLINEGEIIGFPTETVYGLAANALNTDAISKIFKAKGRPQDNPLIVHISDMEMLNDLTINNCESAYKLAEIFWPGPLTMVLKKSSLIPDSTSAGLDTVGIRMPSHKVALDIIRESKLPLAAPSANISGSPSPTSAHHVFNDMNGKIPLIIDGGNSDVGIESTVITFIGNKVHILRPGFITAEDFIQNGFEVEIDKAITSKLNEGEKVLSPGMKYKHYSPKADVTIIDAGSDEFCLYVNSFLDSETYALCYDEDINKIMGNYLSYGNSSNEQAKLLFERLREFDELGAKKVFARIPDKSGVGLAVYNRLLRAAGFEVIKP